MKPTKLPKCRRSKCERQVAYPGAIFCGAACCAMYEGGDR